MALEQIIDDFISLCDCCGYNKAHNLIPLTKKHQVSGADRISNLPDDIISNILSRLPTIDAVQTCVLSRCWKYNWTSIRNICVDCVDFRCDSFDEQEFTQGVHKALEFNNFVDKVLDLTHNSRLRNIHLYCNNDTLGDQMSTWISAVLNRGVQSLIISAKSSDCVVCLKDCTILEELKLSLRVCTLEVPGNNCFSKLKHLYLISELGFKVLSRQSHDTGQLLLNFPVLQVLKLKYFKILNFKSVEIRAPELITFSAYYSWNYHLDDCVIKIHGPKLQKIYSREGFINIDLYAPVVHYIDLHHKFVERGVLAPQVHRILQGVPGLTCLKLNRFVVQALMLRKSDLSRFDQLKQLEVEYCGFKPLLELLHTMPNLENLNIVFPFPYRVKHDQQKPIPRCLVPHLKEVQFMEFRADHKQINLIKLFLRKARKLEKVSVFYADYDVTRSMVRCNLKELAYMTLARFSIHNRPSKEDLF